MEYIYRHHYLRLCLQTISRLIYQNKSWSYVVEMMNWPWTLAALWGGAGGNRPPPPRTFHKSASLSEIFGSVRIFKTIQYTEINRKNKQKNRPMKNQNKFVGNSRCFAHDHVYVQFMFIAKRQCEVYKEIKAIDRNSCFITSKSSYSSYLKQIKFCIKKIVF